MIQLKGWHYKYGLFNHFTNNIFLHICLIKKVINCIYNSHNSDWQK